MRFVKISGLNFYERRKSKQLIKSKIRDGATTPTTQMKSNTMIISPIVWKISESNSDIRNTSIVNGIRSKIPAHALPQIIWNRMFEIFRNR